MADYGEQDSRTHIWRNGDGQKDGVWDHCERSAMSGDLVQERTRVHTPQLRFIVSVLWLILRSGSVVKVGNTSHSPTANELVEVDERSVAKL